MQNTHVDGANCMPQTRKELRVNIKMIEFQSKFQTKQWSDISTKIIKFGKNRIFRNNYKTC